MTDDLDGFVAPRSQPPTPIAVKLAGARLYQYALRAQVSRDLTILDMPIPDDLAELQRDQRLLVWFAHVLEAG